MPDSASLQGELQTQIMSVLWRLGEGTVSHVRAALPARCRSAYTTVQTVLNRLADRGLLARERRGKQIVYSPCLTEADYLTRSIEAALAGASIEARQAVLAGLVGGLGKAELSELQTLAREVTRKRRRRARQAAARA